MIGRAEKTMSILTQEHQTLLSHVINMIPDMARARFAGQLNLSPDQFRQGVMASMGKLVTRIQDQESEPGFKSSIMKLIPGFSTSQATSQLQQYNPGQTPDIELEHLAQQLLNVTFGNRLGSVIDTMAAGSRISQAASAGLMGIASAALLAFLGQNRQGLSGLFPWMSGGLKPNTAAISGAAMGGSFGSVNASYSPKKERRGFLGWLFPLLLAVLTAWGLMNLLNMFGGKKAEVQLPTEVIQQPVAAIKYLSTESVRSVTNLDLGRMIEVVMPSGLKLSLPEKGVENQLLGFIQNPEKVVDKTTWFNFDRILFDTDKATLKSSSFQQLENMAAILKAYPKVNLKIGGYTDSSGDMAHNQKLSADRANRVMVHLAGLGIEASRLKAEGYGSQFPVADNSTPEGRAQNRRIAARVTQK
jgi:OmpA-OmpF porin, OOP family